mmetsp:Transcript_25989/g.22911  ORF Transcript_25989/g.22911 Transcript_25989/m.22911 type:complete len:99 (-) Transcript_25989:168-464(-)
MLQNCKYHVYDFDHMRETPLHWTAKRGLDKMTLLLLQNGADPNAQDITGRTPLHLAAMTNHLIQAKLLISHGASPMIRSEGHKVASDYCSDQFLKNQL